MLILRQKSSPDLKLHNQYCHIKERLRKIKQALEDYYFKMQELILQTGPKTFRPRLKFLTFLDSQSA